MASSRAGVRAVALAAVVVLAGCGQLLGISGETAQEETLTPAPVPSVADSAASASPTATPADTAAAVDKEDSRGYDSLHPTCKRPPEVVIHIQVSALANNDPETNAGIATAWRFAAPSNKRYVGPYEDFVETVESFYRPLLKAETIAYGPMQREGDRAERRVTVGNNGTSTTYRWTLRNVTTTSLDGCWMTTGVREIPGNTTDVPEPQRAGSATSAPQTDGSAALEP